MSKVFELDQIAFELITAKLETQRNDIQNLRNQAAISAAVTGLLATVFASVAEATGASTMILGNDFLGFTINGILLISCITLSLAFSVMVVVSWSEFTFSFDALKLLEKGRNSHSHGEFFEEYVRDGEWFFKDNESKLSLAQNQLWWAMVLGWVQIAPWLLIIVGKENV